MNILMINLPFSGHTNPTLPLARELVKRGHRISYVNAESFREKIIQTGATFVPYKDFPANPSEREKKRKCFKAAYETAMSLTEKFDLLIYEMFFYPGIEIAKRKGIPCVRQFSQPAWSAQTWKDTPAVFKISTKLIDLQVLRKADAADMGLEFTCLKDGILNSNPDLNIVYVPEQFQHRRESFSERYIFTVPMPVPSAGSVRIPYDKMKTPIVYISLGSIISNRGFCKECIRAFGNRDMSVILNTARIKPESLGPIPENIYAYSFVPQMEVLSKADVFLTHCGMNSINEAMCMGVPMVAMPFINDQITNANQLVRLGLAKKVRSFPSRGFALYQAVQEVLGNTEMKLQAAVMKQQMLTHMEWENIIRRIENLGKTDR